MRLIRCLALFALGLMMVAAAPDARAIDAVSVRSDAPAIDLTAVLDHPAQRHRPHPGLDRAWNRRHRPPHRGPRPRRRPELGGVRARQQHRRPARPSDRRAALPHRLVRPAVARSRPVAHRHHHALDRRPPRAAGERRSPTSSASRSIPAPSSPSSSNCAPTSCRSSICGSRKPTRTRSTRSRSTRASSSASPDCCRWC